MRHSCTISYIDVFVLYVQLISYYVSWLSQILSNIKVVTILQKLGRVVIRVQHCYEYYGRGVGSWINYFRCLLGSGKYTEVNQHYINWGPEHLTKLCD